MEEFISEGQTLMEARNLKNQMRNLEEEIKKEQEEMLNLIKSNSLNSIKGVQII